MHSTDNSAGHEAHSDLLGEINVHMVGKDQKQLKKENKKKSESGKIGRKDKKKQETVRGLRRQNMILEKIQDLQVIEGQSIF